MDIPAHPVWYFPLVAKAEARVPTIVVDLDGTIAHEDHESLDANEPLPGAREALEDLRAAGYRIVIFTCRMNTEGRPGSGFRQKTIIEKWLRKHDIPFDEIYDGRHGKPRAEAYIDNKAIRVTPENWAEVARSILEGR